MTNFKEEITDMISDEAYADPDFKKGILLKFEKATIKVTKVDRKNKRTWGEHIKLAGGEIVSTHDGHDVTGGGVGDFPFCKDCQVYINEPSTEDGDKKALDRKDRENDPTFGVPEGKDIL